MAKFFEANRGQLEESIKYYLKNKESSIFFLDDEIILCKINNNQANKEIETENIRNRIRKYFTAKKTVKENNINKESIELVKMKFNKTSEEKYLTSDKKIDVKLSYIKGNDENKWIRNIETYENIIYKNMYKDIDVVFYENDGSVEYDFIINKNADINDISISFEGTENINIDEHDNININLGNSNIIIHKPKSYQIIQGSKQVIDSKFILENNTIKFQVGEYDKNNILIIDPIIKYSTYLGGTDDDYSNCMTIDSNNNVYVVGYTFSIDFDIVNPISPYVAGADIFIAKINKDKRVEYLTYLGGQGEDVANSIVVDDDGYVYITGYTTSSDFPTINSMYQFIGPKEIFISKIKISDQDDEIGQVGELVFSSYIGGQGESVANAIAIDNDKSIYITGYTTSKNYPLVQNLYQFDGNKDIIVSKITTSIQSEIYGEVGQLDFSTCLGGFSGFGNAICIDKYKNIYIAGNVITNDFPLKNQIQDYVSGEDAYIIKIGLNPSPIILFATYLGGDNNEQTNSIILDNDENIYITGYTDSQNYPTVNSIEQYKGNKSIFVSKIKLSQINTPTLSFSTYLGGSNNDTAYSIEVDNNQNIYIAGETDSLDFDNINSMYNYSGNNDGFVMKIKLTSKNGTNTDIGKIVLSTYIGGSGYDCIKSIIIDSIGDIYITGTTSSNDFPIRNELNKYIGSKDVFLMKLLQNKYIELKKIDMILTLPKKRASYSIVSNLECNPNICMIDDISINEKIEEIKIELPNICNDNQHVYGQAKIKKNYLTIEVYYSVILYTLDCGIDEVILYASGEDSFAVSNIEIRCTELNEIINLDKFELIVEPVYTLLPEYTIKDYYVFKVSGRIGIIEVL